MLEICRKLFSSWNENCISYCHWKSNEHLYEGLDGETDLDVFLKPDDKIKAELYLIQLKYIKCVVQKSNRYLNVDEWIGFDEITGRLVHVHLHFQIITGTKFNKEYVFPIDDLIIDTRILNKETGVYTTSYELELVILYSRIVLKSRDKKHIKPNNDYKKEIAYLKERYSKGVLRSILNKLVSDDAIVLYNYIEQEKLNDKEWYDIFHIVYKWLKPYRSKSQIDVLIRYNYYKFFNRIVRTLNSRYDSLFITKKSMPDKGVSICFIGVDGSGKSTVCKEISKWLSWKLENHVFYLGSGDGYKRQRCILSRIISKIQHPEASLLRIAKYYMHQLKRADKYINQGGIALFDRFPQNQFEGIYDGPKIATQYASKMNQKNVRRFAQKEKKIITDCQLYQPDLLFKLVIPAEESIRRKHDSEDMIRRKVEITEKLYFEQSETYMIDATQDYDQEILAIKQKIWQKILEKQSLSSMDSLAVGNRP